VSDVAGIKRLCPVYIACTFNYSPPIGENGELTVFSIKFKHKLVEAYIAQGLKLSSHIFKLKFVRGTIGNLNSVSATQTCGLRTELAINPFEFSMLAARAINLT